MISRRQRNPQAPAARVLARALAGAALAACTDTDDDSSFAERQELGNIHVNSIVPQTPASQLVGAFRQICLDGGDTADAGTASLRAAGYVPVGGWRSGIRDFVIEGRRPMVQISRDGRRCGVRARARTGQDAMVRQRIADWFPAAKAPPSDDPERLVWATGRAPNEGIGIIRRPRGPGQHEITVALVRH